MLRFLKPYSTIGNCGEKKGLVYTLPIVGWKVWKPFVRPPDGEEFLSMFEAITIRWFGGNNLTIRCPWLYHILWKMHIKRKRKAGKM